MNTSQLFSTNTYNGEEEGLFDDGFDPYEIVDKMVCSNNAKNSRWLSNVSTFLVYSVIYFNVKFTTCKKKLAPQESAPTASVTSVPTVYATVDKSKKGGKVKGDGRTVTNNDHYLPCRWKTWVRRQTKRRECLGIMVWKENRMMMIQ